MSLHSKLQQRQAEGRPIRVGLIGAGKFGSMYLAQVPRTPGVHLVGIADLSPTNARANLARVGWEPQRTEASSLDEAMKKGSTFVGDDWRQLVRHPGIDVVMECTGNPIEAVEHCLEAFANRKPVVNVTVEADAFCGPLLARRAAEAGVVYSLAFGDQPALRARASRGPMSSWTRRRTRTGFARRWKRCSSADQDPGAGTGIAADFKGVKAAGCTSSRSGTSCA